MTSIPHEYIIAALLGLGGAALYHLGSVFLYWITLGYEADASFRKMVNQNVDLTLSLSKASGLHKVNTDALYERVGALEERPTTSHEALWAFEKTQPLVTFGKVPYVPHPIQQEFYDRVVASRRAKNVPYSSGKPCPKPTKDLRPGDEVSVKVKVNSVDTHGMTFISEIIGYPTYEIVDSIRTDNK